MTRPLRALSGRPDRQDFARFVAALPESDFNLGLTHVTTGYFIRDMLDANKLAAVEQCPVLNRPLIYAFYGRPAYRNKNDNTPSDLPFLYPAVLILDPQKVPQPAHVFGFDSGAFVDGLMNEFLDPYMPLFDFHMKPDIDSAARLAKAFFGNPEAFLRNEPLPGVAVPDGNFEAVSYSRMVQGAGRGANRLDDRVSTPEVIFDQPLPIEACVKGAILPDRLANDPDIGGRIKAMGVEVEDYEWSGGNRPSEYHMLIRHLAYAMFREFEWL